MILDKTLDCCERTVEHCNGKCVIMMEQWNIAMGQSNVVMALWFIMMGLDQCDDQLIVMMEKCTMMMFLCIILIKNRTEHYCGITVNTVKNFHVRVELCDMG